MAGGEKRALIGGGRGRSRGRGQAEKLNGRNEKCRAKQESEGWKTRSTFLSLHLI